MTTAAERLRKLAGFSGTAAALLLAIGSGPTAGAALVDYSGLPTGTAAEHLLAERVRPEIRSTVPQGGAVTRLQVALGRLIAVDAAAAAAQVNVESICAAIATGGDRAGVTLTFEACLRHHASGASAAKLIARSEITPVFSDEELAALAMLVWRD